MADSPVAIGSVVACFKPLNRRNLKRENPFEWEQSIDPFKSPNRQTIDAGESNLQYGVHFQLHLSSGPPGFLRCLSTEASPFQNVDNELRLEKRRQIR